MYLFSPLLGTAGQFPTYFVIVYAVGFVAAITIGSIAWYNSKRPAGWEDAQRPDFIPDLKADEETSEEPKS